MSNKKFVTSASTALTLRSRTNIHRTIGSELLDQSENKKKQQIFIVMSHHQPKLVVHACKPSNVAKSK